MTFLKYFIPLIEEGNKMGIKSSLFSWDINKCNSISHNLKEFNKLLETYNFNFYDIEEIRKHHGPIFCIEGVGSKYPDKEKQTIFSLPYGTDYVMMYPDYIDNIDYSIFPSEEYAVCGRTLSDKNLYLGSPKYSMEFDEDAICEKYGLKKEAKKAIIIYPDARYYPAKVNLDFLYTALKKEGYEIIVKTRGKNPIHNKEYRGDHYFLDKSWYPHTSMELMKVVDLVVTHESSSAIKEAIFFNKPFLDMDVKLINKHRPIVRDVFRFFYDYDFYKEISGDMSVDDIRKAIGALKQENYDEQFADAIKKYLVKNDNVCQNIINTAYELDRKK